MTSWQATKKLPYKCPGRGLVARSCNNGVRVAGAHCGECRRWLSRVDSGGAALWVQQLSFGSEPVNYGWLAARCSPMIPLVGPWLQATQDVVTGIRITFALLHPGYNLDVRMPGLVAVTTEADELMANARPKIRQLVTLARGAKALCETAALNSGDPVQLQMAMDLDYALQSTLEPLLARL